jgi:aminopeptidase N
MLLASRSYIYPRAFDALAAALRTPSWNETIAAGAARGLGNLADARAMPLLRDALFSERHDALRRAAATAIGELGSTVYAVRDDAVDTIARALESAPFLVRVASFAAAEMLADARLLPLLDRLAGAADDGRLRRDAAEAAMHVRDAQTKPESVASMREELERLRAESQAMRERVDELGARTSTTGTA